MTSSRTVTYRFDFDNGTHWEYKLDFDDSQRLVPTPSKTEVRPWTRLEFCKCPHCPLKEEDHPQCPVAAKIDHIVEDSKDVISYSTVTVTVDTPERQYIRKCAAQNGLVSLFGLIMASSSCPHLDWLRPLARFHLPFASIDETLFRVLSLQLLTEFFAHDRHESRNSKELIQKKYEAVGILNRAFIQRIRAYCSGDADKNAIAALDIWVQAFDLHHESNFRPLKKFFESAPT